MTRRERKQLLRTASDIFRMVPLAVSFMVLDFIWFGCLIDSQTLCFVSTYSTHAVSWRELT